MTCMPHTSQPRTLPVTEPVPRVVGGWSSLESLHCTLSRPASFTHAPDEPGFSNSRAGLRPSQESQRKDSEEDKTLLQHHANTVASVTVVRSVAEAVRTTNVVRFVVPGAAPQNAERPRATALLG